MIKEGWHGGPHRFYCVTCGCSLYTIEDLNRNECEPCVYWLDRVVHWFLGGKR